MVFAVIYLLYLILYMQDLLLSHWSKYTDREDAYLDEVLLPPKNNRRADKSQ